MPLIAPDAVRRIAVVGSGTIGASWAALFLAHGYDVTIYDPQPSAEAATRDLIADAWRGLAALGVAGDTARSHGASPPIWWRPCATRTSCRRADPSAPRSSGSFMLTSKRG